MRSVRWLAAALVAAGIAPVPAAHAVEAPRCDGRLATIVGTANDDIIVGTPRADVIVGLGGQDRIDGVGGDDRICGGADSDVLRGGAGNDRLFGEGNRVQFGRAITRVYGDVLDGGAGDDLLDLGDPTSTSRWLFGERIEFLTEPGAVVVDLAAGTATGQGDDAIRHVPNMSVRTGEGDDTILGTKRGESIQAGPGNDTVTLFGGRDIFREQRTSLPDDDVVDMGRGADIVRAFSGADQILTGAGQDDVVLRGRGPYVVDTGSASDAVYARATDRAGTSYDLGAGAQDDFDLELGVLSGAEGPLLIRVDVPAGLYAITTPGGSVSTAISGIEDFSFARGFALDFLGGDGPEWLSISMGNPGSVPLHAVMGGGDDRVWATRGDDYIDGGDGHDFADAMEGNDTCVQVEERFSC